MADHHVVIAREWTAGAPISIKVTSKGVGVEMQLNAFIDAMVEEAGSPIALMTVTAMRNRLQAAAARVCEKMKQETSAVM